MQLWNQHHQLQYKNKWQNDECTFALTSWVFVFPYSLIPLKNKIYIYSITYLFLYRSAHMQWTAHVHKDPFNGHSWVARRLFISSFFFAHSEWKCSLRLKSSFECCEFIVNNSAFVKFDTIFFLLFQWFNGICFSYRFNERYVFLCVHSKWLHSLIKTNASIFLF